MATRSNVLDLNPITTNFNQFPVHADDAAAFEDGSSVAGDCVEMLAEIDVIAMIYNCPQENNPCAGFAPTPVYVIAWTP